MLAYILRRLLQVIPVLIGTTLLIFILTHVIPGDPVKMLAGEKSLSLQAYKNIKHRLWLDRPLHIQYLHYVDRLLHGDFGDSSWSRSSSAFWRGSSRLLNDILFLTF